MSWAGKLMSWATGEPAGAENADLRELAADLDREARRLARHAELAPNHLSREELTRLAREQAAIATALRQALGDEREVRTPPSEPAPPSGLNHWGRLVQNLEHLRAQRDRLFEAAKDRDADEPLLSQVLERLALRIDDQLDGIRALIARADPQSLV